MPEVNLLDFIQGADVERKTLGEVAEIQRGKRITKNQLVKNGKYPVVSGGTGYMGYFDDYNRDGNTITIAQYGTAGYVKWQTEKFWANDVCYSVFPNEDVNKKYLYYCLMNEQEVLYSLKTNAIPAHLPQIDLSNLTIPIPSLEIQQKVVEILDKMTDYVTELTAELTAELTLRQKQYAYYRDQLLTFPSQSDSDESLSVRWTTLGEIGEVRMCKRILKNQTSAVGDVPFFKIGTFGKSPDAFISRELFEEYKAKYNYPKAGDLLISAAGTIGRVVKFDGNDAYFQDSNIVWIENDETQVMNEYLRYYYQIANWGTSTGGTITRLYNDGLKKMKIAVPSLTTQKRIVEILDKFDKLTSDLTDGLPREIELRRKQYEYWREQLLNFIQ
ncbi:restriction endonuclease subunit S [Lactococcus cremoris]|uniref:Restriction endonuclease subunit S n=1 Tax=Lactococcus lactis subsp. cremoris TaxID=1359 RepID=A0AAX4A2J2_LACLC|nr:restriction endonuclease subunit S [Lactococcus cremoris]KGH33840.1 hypothetical protein JL36_03480 [Lactococcus cremoris]QSE64230.1 restriction endonuclease subunit S [Lactococcus cremoris]WMX69847.1 restriction endonuclease subunit S [Lactococcus cremoris]